MQQSQTLFTIHTRGKGLHEATPEIARWVDESGIRSGLLSLLCRHTSAGLVIMENAAPAVRRDIERWLSAAAPEGARYEHDDEGPDDMPAHIRTMLTGATLSIPVDEGRMMLGTWQGIFLAEHRAAPHRRTIAAHLIGE